MLLSVGTFPAGTVFDSWIGLERATDLQAGFFQNVRDVIAEHFTIGGWAETTGPAPTIRPAATLVDWSTELQQRRVEVMDALTLLT